MALNQTFGDGIGDDLGQQRHGPDGVVVTRNRVGEVVRVGVRVEDADHGDAELAGFIDCQVFTNRVHHPERTRGFLQVADSAERLV